MGEALTKARRAMDFLDALHGTAPKSGQRGDYDITDRTKHPHRRAKQTGEEAKVLDMSQRGDAIEYSRDLHRNDSTLATILWQIDVNVVGDIGGKAVFHCPQDEKWAENTGEWYNGTWAKSCDGQNLRTHLTRQLANGLVAMLREGDCLLFLDDSVGNDGRLYWYEADQLVQINKQDWAANAKAEKWTEPDPADRRKRIALIHDQPGIVRDRRGRVHAFVVSASKRSKTVKWDEATIIPADSAVLLRLPWRLSQLRGTARTWSVYDTLSDVKEGIAEELRSLRELNKKAIITYDDQDIDEVLSRFGTTLDEVIEDATAEGVDPKTILGNKRYASLDKTYEHATTTHLGKDAKVDVIQSARPAPAMQEFYERERIQAGAVFGLARCYTLLKVSSSFSSARAEFVLSWATFQVLQKLLERLICDWICSKAVAWAIEQGPENGGLSAPKSGATWSVSFQWPTMPMIDVARELPGIVEQIRNGMGTWQKFLGPGYRKVFAQLAKELNELSADGLDRILDLFFTVSGESKAAATAGNENAIREMILEALDQRDN